MLSLPKQKLSVQIRYINPVHIDNFQVLEPRKGQILEQLTTQSTRSNNQHFSILLKIIPQLQNPTLTHQNDQKWKCTQVVCEKSWDRKAYISSRFESGADEIAGTKEKLVEITWSAVAELLRHWRCSRAEQRAS